MNNPYKRRRFYSEQLPTEGESFGKKRGYHMDFTLPDSPKISNLELIEEIDDFKLDEEGDIFSDFLGVDKASFLNQMANAQEQEEDSFELEVKSRKQGLQNSSNLKTTKIENNQKIEVAENPKKEYNFDLKLDEGLKDTPFCLDLGLNKLNEQSTLLESNKKGNPCKLESQEFEINCPLKRKMMMEMFNFKVDVSSRNGGNRLRSQSYSVGGSNSIYDFLNRK